MGTPTFCYRFVSLIDFYIKYWLYRKTLIYFKLTPVKSGRVPNVNESWKDAIESKELKVNIEKTKVLVSGKECKTVVSPWKHSCGVCGGGVGRNSVLYRICGKWTHKRVLGLQNFKKAQEFDFFLVSFAHFAEMFEL